MFYQSLPLVAVILASVSAIPTEIAKLDVTNDPNGNIRILFSDQTFKLGTINISQIVETIAAACSTQGQCDTSPIDIKGTTIVGGYVAGATEETLTVNPSGSYPTWIHNGLIDTLSAAVHAVMKCEDVRYQYTCGDPRYYCPETPDVVSQCTVPQYWGINYQTPDMGNAAPPFIGADMALNVDDGAFCATFTTILGAVAGAVNGAAGGIFTLVGLACHK